MATVREYAYTVVGNILRLVEKDVNFDNDPTSKNYGPGVDRGEWKSPLATVADALQLQYTYVPSYRIESTDVSTATVESWDQDNDGNFRLRAASGTDWTSSPDLSSVTYIVLTNAGRFNGLHKVSLVQSTRIVTTTKVSASTSATLFEETPTLYYDVSIMQDESFELDLPDYLALAIEYYLKAKMVEQLGDLDKTVYYMKEFRKQIEKHDTSRQWGARMISSGPFAIK